MTFEEWWEEPIPDTSVTKEQARQDVMDAMLKVYEEFDLKAALSDAFEAGFNAGQDSANDAAIMREIEQHEYQSWLQEANRGY